VGAYVHTELINSQLMTRMHVCWLVGWSSTSLVSTNTAISETNMTVGTLALDLRAVLRFVQWRGGNRALLAVPKV